jgi:KDO2-lipid IV(A) lauroyltransferase
VDLATLPRRDIARFERDHLRVVNGERLKLLDEPGPLIVLSAHTGNPELAVQGFTNRGRAFVALVQPLQPPALANYLLKLRSSTGGAFYEADRRGVRACLEALRDGKLVAIIADRDIQGTGVCVDLCGRRVKLPRGPFELARRKHASLLPILAAREGVEDQVVFVEEPYRVRITGNAKEDVREAAQHWACILGQHLLRFPGQWKVLEDYWTVHACGEG